MEMLIEEAEAGLAASQTPFGVLLRPEESVADVERCKIADPRHARMLEFQLSVLQRVLARAGQRLNIDKCEALVPEAEKDAPRPRSWTDRELSWYLRTGHYPQEVPPERDSHIERLAVGVRLLVLGSYVSHDRTQRHAFPARLQAAWLRWSQVRRQVGCRHSPKSRILLVEFVILPTLLWGLETVPLSQTERRRLDGVQRRMVGRALLIGRRSGELLEDFFRRRERCISGAIRRHTRGLWSELCHCRMFTFAGHAARLAPAEHMSAQTLAWPSDQWWSGYKETLPPKAGGQIGRRAADRGTPGILEAPFRDAFELMRNSASGRSILQKAASELGDWPRDWRRLAQAREVWRLFSRHICLRRSGPRQADGDVSQDFREGSEMMSE